MKATSIVKFAGLKLNNKIILNQISIGSLRNPDRRLNLSLIK